MRLFITGGTGLVGGRLIPALVAHGHEILLLTRRKDLTAPPGCTAVVGNPCVAEEAWLKEMDHCDGVVHLAGENVFGKRWSKAFKQRLWDSRVVSTDLIAKRLAAKGKPKAFVSASAIGIYGERGDEELTEASSPGDDFLAKLCVAWEAAAEPARAAGIRVVHPRLGVVLAEEGGALKEMVLPFRLFAGGPIGGGKQWISWIHIDDLVQALCRFMTDESLVGAYNCTAPEPIRQWGMGKAIGEILHRPFWLPVPRFALRIALGEVAGVAAGSQRVYCKRLHETGFPFSYHAVKPALRELLGR